jgi:hypothetical protein
LALIGLQQLKGGRPQADFIITLRDFDPAYVRFVP